MKFSFKAEVEGLMITLTAERIYRSKQSERFKLTINGTDSVIVVQTNRPAVEEKKNGKAPQWHIAEGKIGNKTKLENVYQQLEKAIRKQPSSFQRTLNFIQQF
ncbi:MAG: hypothetical protein M3R72_02665 [Bacteroidota bacterium]|nr:hypothetical protein [Bacteroidota bacterium]